MLPELAHWFGIHGADLEDLPDAELAAYIAAIPCQPIGSLVVLYREGD